MIMDTLTAILIIESDAGATDRQEFEAWGSLIKSGVVWSLQGSYGRGAHSFIQAGILTAEGDLTEWAEEVLADSEV